MEQRFICPLTVINPSQPPTAGFAQPAGYAGAKQCFAKPLLRPLIRGGVKTQTFMRLPCPFQLTGVSE